MAEPAFDALTTYGAAKNFFGLTDESEAALLKDMIPRVSALIQRWLNRTHVLTGNSANPITEFHCGAFQRFLVLSQWPASNFTVWLDHTGYYGKGANAFAASTQLTEGTDYVGRYDQVGGAASQSAMLEYLNGSWPGLFARDSGSLASYDAPAQGNIKVTYAVGWPSVPPDMEQAVLLVIAKIRNSAEYGQALEAENFEDYGYHLAKTLDGDFRGYLGGEVGAMLSRFRIVPVGVAT